LSTILKRSASNLVESSLLFGRGIFLPLLTLSSLSWVHCQQAV